MAEGGTYLLVLHCRAHIVRQVGVLGPVALVPGLYLYIGSARRGLAARLARHARSLKKHRWHIDYLLDGTALRLAEIWISGSLKECALAALIRQLPEVVLPQPGLGASDCRCRTHFYRYTGNPAALRHRLAAWGLEPATALLAAPTP